MRRGEIRMIRREIWKPWIGPVLCASAILALRCASLGPLAGTVTQSGNGMVCGVVVDSGTLVPGARVLLVPAQYDPKSGGPLPDSLADTTDPSGAFGIFADKRYEYNVEVEPISGKNALFRGVGFSSGDTQSTGLIRLATPGAIKVIAPDTERTSAAYVYIPGTMLFSPMHGDMAILDNVPAGNIPTLYFNPASAGYKSRTIQTNIPVESGKTTTVTDYSLWKHSKPLYLNTTVSGANVAGNVTDFPALVRLTSNNFDFSQARVAGEDVRFDKADGTPLAFEIERWDTGAGHAEIWVKLDTVYGNDSSHYFVMHWGNPVAVNASNGSAVFDTGDGFQGVWHLSGPGNTIAFDATFNLYDGNLVGISSTSTVGGIIGQARMFDGLTNALSMPNTAAGKLDFNENDAYSMSLWVYADTIDTLWHAIAGKGHEQYYIQYKCSGNNKAKWEFVEYHDRRGWEVVDDSTAPGPKQWLYIVGVRSGSSQKLYFNGVLASEAKWTMPGTYARNTGDNFSFGRYERPDSIPNYQGWSYFKGKIDEARVMSVASTPDRIKLCYMNQKEQDALLKW